MPDNAETLNRFKPKVIEMLVDEVLISQEMKRLRLKVSDDEVQSAFAALAERNGVPYNHLNQFLQTRGIDLVELQKQIAAQLGWGKIINQNIRAGLQVSEREVSENRDIVRNMAEDAAKVYEYNLAEITLLAQTEEEHKTNLRLSQDLIQKIREGANFGKLAQQFSQSESAKMFGEIGWIPSAHMNPQIAELLRNVEVGDVEAVIQPDTVQIFRVLDRKLIATNEMNEISDEEVGDYIISRKTGVAIKSYLKNLRKNAYIQFFDR
jgi:peptidyl-prolyl cis-trans isomerase SurA